MIKNTVLVEIGLGLLVLGLVTTVSFARLKRIQAKKIAHYQSTKYLIEDVYTNISGFNINSDEYSAITEKGGAPTYGEIKYDSLQTLLDDLKLTRKDVFYDLGCGVGKVCVQVALDTPVKKSVGIELSSTRIKHAKSIKTTLAQDKKIQQAKKLEFIEQNFADANISDATVIFMCSTCFSEELMKIITTKMAQLKNGLKVFTLKQLPDIGKFKLRKEYKLPMTWSEKASVYMYELDKGKSSV